MKKYGKIAVLALLAALCLFGMLYNARSNKAPEIPPITGNLDISILKVGKADAMILRTQHHTAILDCGEQEDGEEVAEYLRENGIAKVDYIFITHFDKDHVGGFPTIMEHIEADKIIVPSYEGNNDAYANYLDTVLARDLQVTALTKDLCFTLDDVLFEVSAPKQRAYEESDNDYSLALSITHGQNAFLFTGDAEKARLAEILADFGHPYDFLKVPHHGRYGDLTQELIDTTTPAFTAICDSEKNPAEEETLSLLDAAGSTTYCTKDGNISVSSDGAKITISQN